MRQTVSKAFVALVAILTVTSMAAMPVMAASTLNYADGKAPNPQFNVEEVTVDEWDNGEFDSALEYYDDSGDATRLDGELNQSSDVDDLGTGTVNPISLTATDIQVAEFGEFPRNDDEDGENSASALDASEWTTSGASVSDATTAPGVDAVEFSGSASSDAATYGNISALDSDIEKRDLQLAADIESASGEPVLQLNDSDGDYVEVKLYDADANQTADNVLANATGEGHVLQTEIGQLAVQGTGDGSMGEIVEVHVEGDVTAQFSLINAEKTSQYTFGEKYVENSDGELETVDITEPHGEYSVHSVDTFGSTFDDATMMGLSFPAHVSAEYAPSEDVDATFQGDNAYPNWDSVAQINYRLSLPDAYDISYSGVALEQTTQWPGTRYVSVEIKEGVGDTAFGDIDNANSVTSQFDAEDKTVTLDDTISPGTEYYIGIDLKLTSDEASAMQAASGGAGVMDDGSGGGIWSLLTSPIGMVVSAIGAFLGGRKFGVF